MYITTHELVAAFSQKVLIQLSNDDYQATDVDFVVLEQAIKTACERIDAALRGRYRLPLASVPTVLHSHCLYLARHWLYARRPEMKIPETVEKTYQQTIKELEQIAQGKLHLGIAGFDDTPPANGQRDQYGDVLKDSGEYRVRAKEKLNTDGY